MAIEIYALTATYASMATCTGMSDEATFRVASPGRAATGGGYGSRRRARR